MFIVDAVSRKYFTSDVSWLWDIDFEMLNNQNIHNIVLAGKYCNDLAVRFSYTDIPKDKIREFTLKEKIKELQRKMAEEDFTERMVTVINNQEILKEYDRLQHGIDKEMNIETYDIDFEI